MKIPTIKGIIERRILINYQIEAQVLKDFLPPPFQPKLIKGKGIAGICLIRLKQVRPKGLPKQLGISSENGAHRIAVEWMEEGVQKEGVYVPRRDTSSRLNALAGGRIFPGVHHLADFSINEREGHYAIEFKSDDETFLSIDATETNDWNPQSIFESQQIASDFLKQGSVGYSPDKTGDVFDGLELHTYEWKTIPLSVANVRSSFFENETLFPKGSIQFDNALLMKNIEHEWKGLNQIKV